MVAGGEGGRVVYVGWAIFTDFFSPTFAGQIIIINFLLPARLGILKGIFFSLIIPQHIDIAAAYNVSLASMLREMR